MDTIYDRYPRLWFAVLTIDEKPTPLPIIWNICGLMPTIIISSDIQIGELT